MTQHLRQSIACVTYNVITLGCTFIQFEGLLASSAFVNAHVCISFVTIK